MLATCLVLSTIYVLAAVGENGCGPNVLPMVTRAPKPCTLRASRDALDVTDAEVSASVQRGLENGAQLSERIKNYERVAASKHVVRLNTPEYHHYLTNAPTEMTIQMVEAGIEDLANSTAVAREFVQKYGVAPEAAGDFLISLKIPAAPSKVVPTPQCNVSSIYRTHDGSCNNLDYPTWGMTGTPFTRIAKSIFHDGINEPRKSVTGKELPNTRVLRVYLMPTGLLNDKTNTLMVMQYGQILAHDVALSGDQFGIDGLGIQCCTDSGASLPSNVISIACLPIKIPVNDVVYSPKGITCLSLVRSTKSYTTGGYLGPAETINSVNHLVDASFIYGFDQSRADLLREFTGGRLKVQTLPDGRLVLPQVDDPVAACSLVSPNETCFVSGDDRVNQNTQLTVIHIMMLREHNRIASELSSINPHWNDERIYQVTRKILTAIHEHIVYSEFLPQIIDEKILEKYGLKPPKTGYSGCYNSSINPSTLHEFTEAIYRIFHGIAQSDLLFYKEPGCPVGKIKISKWMDKPEIIVQDNHLDELALGLTEQPAMKNDKTTVYELNRNLFRVDASYGQDLDAFDITRSRDNGLGSLNDYRELIGLPRAKKFSDFRDTMQLEDAIHLGNFYEHPDDVDLMMVMLEQRKTNDQTVLTAILLEQFYRWKCGDRFFYDIGGAPHSFTEGQLNEIRKASISRIICDNADNITRIQPNSFRKISKGNPLTDCKMLPVVDLSYWKESS